MPVDRIVSKITIQSYQIQIIIQLQKTWTQGINFIKLISTSKKHSNQRESFVILDKNYLNRKKSGTNMSNNN
jgi:hypothetical protein